MASPDLVAGTGELAISLKNPVHAAVEHRNRVQTISPAALARRYSPATVDTKETTADTQLSNSAYRVRKNEKYEITFLIPGGLRRLNFSASSKMTVADIKKRILEDARAVMRTLVCSGEMPLTKMKKTLKMPEDYCLNVLGTSYYIMNDKIALHRVDLLQLCSKAYVSPELEMVKRRNRVDISDGWKQTVANELAIQTEIADLIGPEYLQNFLTYENLDITCFRRYITRKRLERLRVNKMKSTKLSGTQFLPEYRNREPLPVPVPPSLHLQVSFPTKQGEPDCMKTTLACKPSDTIASLKNAIFRKYSMIDPNVRNSGTGVDDYVLKVTGSHQFFVAEDCTLMDYDYVRKCVGKKENIELSVLAANELEQMRNPEKFLEQVSIIDQIHGDTSYMEWCAVPLVGVERERVGVEGTDEVEIRETIVAVRVEGGRGTSNEMSTSHLANPDAFTPMNVVYEPLQIRLWGLENVFPQAPAPPTEPATTPPSSQQPESLYVAAELFHGGESLCERVTSPAIPAHNNPVWDCVLVFGIAIRNIPRGTRVCFTVFSKNDQSAQKDVPVGWVSRQLIDHDGFFREGHETYRIWPRAHADPTGTCCENPLMDGDTLAPLLVVEYERRAKPLLYTKPTTSFLNVTSPRVIEMKNQTALAEENKNKIEAAILLDPLSSLTPDDRALLWNFRHYCTTRPEALVKFLQSISWNSYEQVTEAYLMMYMWTPMDPIQALELLDSKFSDPEVREYSVRILEDLNDAECQDFLIQLTQALKHEAHHTSALADYLLTRALSNQKIGHCLFWHLKAELHDPTVSERYCILLEAYLRGCGSYRTELVKQNNVLRILSGLAEKVKKTSASDRRQIIIEDLKKVKWPAPFQLPLDPRMVVKGVIPHMCKNMDSKKLPLWLVFENAESIGKPIFTIFKLGDDIRQDVLTLQMIRIMDKIWRNEGLDLRMNPYGAIATGFECGMIEVVLSSNTTANINKEAGGTKAVLEKDTLTKWLRSFNKTDKEWALAQETFCLSCAGYCVATYVLGIGDRHNDNIMVTHGGRLFHIDFGHFLGNYKKKKVLIVEIKREAAPFVLTPDYAYVMGGASGEQFAKFVELCGRAYNILRRHSHRFINLFLMMLSTGIPELQKLEDILYLQNALRLDADDETAAKAFKDLIYESLSTWTTQFNNFTHIMAH